VTYAASILGGSRGVQHDDSPAQSASRFDRVLGFRLDVGARGICQHRDPGRRGDDLVQQLQPLRRQGYRYHADARDVATGLSESGDETEGDGVSGTDEHDRDRRGGGLRREPGVSASDRGYHVDAPTHQLGRQRRQLIVLKFRPPEIDR
jgi:hypothetical protein